MFCQPHKLLSNLSLVPSCLKITAFFITQTAKIIPRYSQGLSESCPQAPKSSWQTLRKVVRALQESPRKPAKAPKEPESAAPSFKYRKKAPQETPGTLQYPYRYARFPPNSSNPLNPPNSSNPPIILPSCHHATMHHNIISSYHYMIISSSCHHPIIASRYHIIISSNHHVIKSPCHHIITSSYHHSYYSTIQSVQFF